MFTLVVGAGLSGFAGERGKVNWDTYSDTWVATDGLGRVVPTQEAVGSVRKGRTVGIFYFLWLGGHGRVLYDVSRILEVNPEEPAYGPRGAFHFWGEPLFGYYLSDDESVIRKHAQMLSDAGVDVLFFDVTNAFTYDTTVERLCEVFEAIRAEGMATPQIAFLAHSREGEVVQRLYDRFYGPGKYGDLWFRWRGKPLVLAAPDALSSELNQFFAVRESWAWSRGQKWFGDGQDKWPWVDHYPQTPGWHETREQPEQVSVCVAQHPVSNIGRSFRQGKQPLPGEIEPEQGLCFAEQWERALAVDPQLVFVTGWNEWVAQRFISDKGGPAFLGKRVSPGETYFVDQYNQEFSRDIEPMRGGHGDNYYYQLVANIRRYKGVRAVPAVERATVTIDGRFRDWVEVRPEFRDTLDDPVRREHPGWQGAGTYVNRSGRNDLALAKVAYDEEAISFYVRSKEALSPSTDANWMLLLLDIDGDSATGWLGYDWVVNRWPRSEGRTSVERHSGSGFNWEPADEVAFAAGERELELTIPWKILGRGSLPAHLDFKWADHLQGTGDWTDFVLNGDVAPNDRFNYRAKLE